MCFDKKLPYVYNMTPGIYFVKRVLPTRKFTNLPDWFDCFCSPACFLGNKAKWKTFIVQSYTPLG